MNRIEDVTNYITECDEEVGKALQLELDRQRRNLELIASENIVSPAVMLAMGTVPTNKYAEGYPGKRYYGGCEDVDILENLAIERAKKLFGCDHVCVQPHSGANANTAVYQALIKPGDTVMGLNLAHGGHLTHGSPVNLSGILYNFVPYNVNDDGVLDYDAIRKLARECKPKMIVAGASAYPREIRFDIFADIAKEVGAYLFVDMAHIAGLVAAGLHQSPVPYADVVTTTTHKTLRGPRGGMIMCKEEYAKAINKAIFPGTQGGPLMHIIAAKAVCFGEALKPEFKTYQEQVVKNAKALAEAMVEEGFNLVSGGTDNHLILVDLQNMNITGKGMKFRWLNNAGFEMELSSGKHLLVDPWLDEAQIYPISINEIERADYVLLTHTHDDHSDSIGRIQKRFPQAAIFVGDLSAEALCKEYDLNVERLFRIRGGEEYEFDDVKIEVISARHTESKGGNYWDRGYCIQKDGSRRETMWYGSLTTEEQIHRMEKYRGNEIAFMHVSPKQDHQMFARLVQAINPKAVIPHHYDIWETLFAAKPELLADMKLPADKVNAEHKENLADRIWKIVVYL